MKQYPDYPEDYPISKDVKVPVRHLNNRGFTAALRKLEVDESVLLPTTAGSVRILCYSIDEARGGLGARGGFIVRSEGDGARAWRVK